jgi:tripartite ATP-independent transporter DctP family solute receptor
MSNSLFNHSRRHFVKTAGIAGAGIIAMPWSTNASAADFVYKIGTDLPASHPLNIRLKEAGATIKKETNGVMELRVFPNNQLGGDPAMFTQLRAGALEFFTISGANVLSTLVPKTSISGLGFAFKNYQQVFQAMDGGLGKLLRSHISNAGLVVMDNVWDNGFRQITSNTKPIISPDDLKNFKIRVPIGKLWISLFESLGAAPSGISFNEVYSALQTHVVDGQENALAVASVAKLYEVQKYCSISNHMWDGFWLLGNKAAWDKLPQQIQEVVSRNLNASALLQRQDVASLNANLQKTLEQKNMIFNVVDPAPFQEKLRKRNFYADWKKEFGEEEWSLLEQVTGKLV